MGEDINYSIVSSFWHRCRDGKLLYKLKILFLFFSFHFYLFIFSFLFVLALGDRLSRKSSSSLENMDKEDN